MKQSLIKVASVAAFVAIAGYGVYTNQKTDSMSELMLANVEALADDSEIEEGVLGVYYPQPGDPNYGYTYCVCWGKLYK